MPKTEAEAKNALLITRVTPQIKEVVEQQASREGLTTSEWLRNLIIKELKSENLLPTVFKVPKAPRMKRVEE
jgi:antitoxin component of RelBE/YafQ-DinJ toxin-antitoxin module